ncbi:BT_3928 family protein [Capnocytophaga sp.]|uniref:BT_3928 family protein n=1 Tax=Capnocytophaga sp. TaxID=44737 RepID=UPI0026DB272D|nr:BT_3928 family protein [Capnocytophaga sp.]MDO5106340.1 DoxX family protein [Capnocytophaga sp.]
MKYAVYIVRFVLGILFIISGLIKLNDPVGFAFKLEEYFSPPVLNLPFLEPLAFALAVFVCVVEVLLGVMLIMGIYRKITLWSFLAMLVFFGFLTFYSAYYNKVTDCGCFGDAIKFTPWQSFGKDIFLLVLTLFLLANQKYIEPISKGVLPVAVSAASLVGCLLLVHYVYNHLPVKDFRPYKIGVNIPQGMVIPEGAPMPKFDYHWKFMIDGKEQVIVTQGDYPKVEGEFIAVETKEVDKGYVPPIHDFFIEKDDESYFDQMMSKEKLLMVISYNLEKSDEEAFTAVKKATDKALKKGYTVIGLTSILQQAETIKNKYELNFDFYFNDETTLKTMIRSNPGIMILSKGTIIDKKHFNDLDKLNI